MRALILGSLVPQTARTAWQWLAAGHEIEALWIGANSSGVWRRRDRRLRWLAPTWSVEAAARAGGFPVRRVGPLRRNAQLASAACRPRVDVVIGCCFPYFVPESVLAYYPGRVCNLHPALLPLYRGPCPLPAILYDEALDASGMTLHLMAAGFDEGAVIAQRPVAWPGDGWFRTWEADLADASAQLATEAIPQFLAGRLSAEPQRGPAQYVRAMPREALSITASIDQRRAAWLAGSLGRITPLIVPTADGPALVGPTIRSRSAPTRQPPRCTWTRVECDVADARLEFRRWNGWLRRRERLRELAALARRPLAA